MQCPHHSFFDESLLSTFYRGVLSKFRMLLDTASNGNFLGKEVDEGLELVENLAQSDGNYGEDYDRSSRGVGDSENHRKEMKALNDKLDKLLQQSHKPIHFVGEFEDQQVANVDELQEEVNYVSGQGGGYNQGFNNYRNHPNFSYRSNNVANPQDQVYPPQANHGQGGQPKAFVPFNQPQGFVPNNTFQGNQGNYHGNQGNFQSKQAQGPPGFSHGQGQDQDMRAMLQQIIQGQATGAMDLAKKMAEIHNKVDCSYTELSSKIEIINSKIKQLENNKGIASSSKTQGTLPGKPEQNPKEYVNAITLRRCHELPPMAILQSNEDIAHQAGEDGFADDHEHITFDNVCILGNGKPAAKAKFKEDPKKKEPSLLPPPYKPKLPFPGRFKKQLMEKYKALFDKQMSEIQCTMPLMDAFMLVPQYAKFLKDAVVERTKELHSKVVLTHECSAIIQRQVVPKKLGDPGSFTLPCELGPLAFNNCLCDLGASVSLMPLSVAQRLGFTKYKECRISLVLADRSVRFPVGMLEDLAVKIGDVEVPTDFVVLEMDEEPKDPLILGRPFLATAGAVIDVKSGKISLHMGKKTELNFVIKGAMKKPTIEGQAFSVEAMDDYSASAVNEQPLEEALALDATCLGVLFSTIVEAENEDREGEKKADGKKAKKKGNKNDSTNTMSLHPLKLMDGAIEYKVKCKGWSKPFARARAILHRTVMKKSQKEGVEELLTKVLNVHFSKATSSAASPVTCFTISCLPRSTSTPPHDPTQA